VESNLALQLFIATMTVGATVLMHLSGLAGLIALMRVHKHWLMTSRPLWDQSAILLGVAFGLFALHTVEIWAYAALYLAIAATSTFEEALYFSTVTYSTIGYGDLTLPMHWRILGAVEGANGVILLGWSTAFFVSVVARLRALEHDWLGATSEDEI
jgi:voltage-gated potassium channel